ncbi:MAG TPA: hypothetical protein ENJ75_00185 [Candidatus Kaiserbacteria bacterium]|nr:hypothetical protein [Candidatus Kaiserbacteria bacterium]
MKRSVLFLTLLATCLFSYFAIVSICNAGTEWMKNGQGLLKQVERPEVLKPLTAEEREAMKNPGEEIPFGKMFIVENERHPLKSFWDFFHYRIIKKQQKVVVFDPEKGGQGCFVYLNKDTTKKSEPKFAWYVAFALVGLVAMIYSNYRVWRYGFNDKKFATEVVAIIAIIVPIITLFAAAIVVSAAVAAAIVVSAAVAFISVCEVTVIIDIATTDAVTEEKVLSFRIFSVVYCIAMVTVMFV